MRSLRRTAELIKGWRRKAEPKQILTHWDKLTDQEMWAKIQAEGAPLTPDQITDEYLRGMNHYRSLYPAYDGKLLSLMVRIDIANGGHVCSCGLC